MRKYIIPAIVLIILVTMFAVQGIKKEEDISDKVIRFHVIANSDSPEDQAIKLKIRDRILEDMGKQLSKSTDLGQSRDFIEHNLKNIENISKQEIQRNGKDYGVNACLGEFLFPAKTYGNLVFPAGRYQALKVVIGEGKGKNWWCVMFPPLCFVDISHGVTAEQSVQEIEDVLNDEMEDQIEVDFKMAEWWNGSRTRLAKMFSFFKND
ncbi:MAG: stage II sporulation protein R [Clostridia bacterium]|nr:stage II sporulation protein R [Clostridia bacterium]